LVLGEDEELPLDLGGVRVLVVVLWRQYVACGDADLPSTASASVDTCVGCRGAGGVLSVEGCVRVLLEMLSVLVEGHFDQVSLNLRRFVDVTLLMVPLQWR
jgi:hypothetical protein